MPKYEILNNVDRNFLGARRRLSAGVTRELPKEVGDELVASGDAKEKQEKRKPAAKKSAAKKSAKK